MTPCLSVSFKLCFPSLFASYLYKPEPEIHARRYPTVSIFGIMHSRQAKLVYLK